MIDLKQFLESEEHESERLVRELEAHEAGWPALKTEFDKIDKQCVVLAQRHLAEVYAGSPKAIETEADLKKLRWKRDGIKSAFSRKRDELLTKIQAHTRHDIDEFVIESLDRAKSLGRLYQFQRIATAQNILTDRKTVRITHNGAALESARDRIFEAMKQVRAMQNRPVAEVRARVAEFEAEFAGFRLSTMRVEEVSPRQAEEMRPESSSVGYAAEKLNSLSARLDALERGGAR